MDAVLRLQSIPIALIFLVAGLSKLPHPKESAAVLRAYRLASRKTAVPMAVALAIGELLLAAALLILPPMWASIASLVVLTVVTGAVIGRLRAGVQMDCGCLGGGMPAVVSWWTVARNAVVSIPAFFLLSSPSGLPASDELFPALMIVSLEACAIFLIAAALSMKSMVEARSRDWAMSV